MPVTTRLVTREDDSAVAAFGRLQEATYGEPELLIPPSMIPRMVAGQSAARRNFLLVAEADGQLVGGTLFHYLAASHTGFSSFLTVAHEARGQGVARALHEARFDVLDQQGGPVRGLFIDVVAPERQGPIERERERAVGSDPALRRRIFHHLGFRRVEVAYYQPPDGPGEEPITSMDLLFCPRQPAEAIPTEWVVDTMRAYWTPWLGLEAADLHAAELKRRCGGPLVPLTPA